MLVLVPFETRMPGTAPAGVMSVDRFCTLSVEVFELLKSRPLWIPAL